MTPQPPIRPLIQIVPFRSTNPDGVGDYARLLAEALRRDHGYETVFIVASPDEGTAALDDGWRTISLSNRDAPSLIDAVSALKTELGDCPIVFHLSAYGFHNRGIPLWLPEALSALKKSGKSRLVAVFHELFATAPPWKSAFWLGWLQARIAARVARLSDGGITTVGVYERWLRPRMKPGAAIVRAPVFSNMGEPQDVPPIDQRPNRAIVFGTNGLASLVYGTHRDDTEAALAALQIEDIVDVGSRRPAAPDFLGQISILSKGRLDAGEVSRELLESRYAFLPYDTARLGKSTIFAALAAHGVIPICLTNGSRGADGLDQGSHFLTVNSDLASMVSGGAAQQMQDCLVTWYAQHGITYCSNAFASLIGDHHAPESEATPQC